MMKRILAVSALAVAFPAAAVYKCKNSDGKTTFQEIPCAATEAQSSVRTFEGTAPAVSPGMAERPPEVRSAINVAILQGYPVRGMTLKELRSAMGEPSRINTGDYPGGSTEQRIYAGKRGTYVVYTENGVVRSIESEVMESESGQPQQARTSCPTELDIRNAEVSANSIILSEVQRRERQMKIRQMRECRSG